MGRIVEKTIKERFREKVGLDWQWRASKNASGYGIIGVGDKVELAHRLSYKIHNGQIPDNMQVLHTCDDRGCVNPEHLYLGTNHDNIMDRVKRNRKGDVSGEKNGLSKLNKKQILEIRERYKNGENQHSIGKQYGVCKATIYYIVNELTWKHI